MFLFLLSLTGPPCLFLWTWECRCLLGKCLNIKAYSNSLSDTQSSSLTLPQRPGLISTGWAQMLMKTRPVSKEHQRTVRQWIPEYSLWITNVLRLLAAASRAYWCFFYIFINLFFLLMQHERHISKGKERNCTFNLTLRFFCTFNSQRFQSFLSFLQYVVLFFFPESQPQKWEHRAILISIHLYLCCYLYLCVCLTKCFLLFCCSQGLDRPGSEERDPVPQNHPRRLFAGECVTYADDVLRVMIHHLWTRGKRETKSKRCTPQLRRAPLKSRPDWKVSMLVFQTQLYWSQSPQMASESAYYVCLDLYFGTKQIILLTFHGLLSVV